MRRLLVTMFGALLLVGLMVPPSASAATGTWDQYPKGTSTFSAQIQQPINSANTSNWSSKSKGGIPVMWKLTQTTGPAVFESIYTTPSTADDYAYVSYTDLANPVPLSSVSVSTNYSFTLGDCHGGSLRWDIWLSDDGGQTFWPVTVYYGDPRNLASTGNQSCTGTYDESGTNLMLTNLPAWADYRFELNLSGQYVTWADVLAATNDGGDMVYGYQLTVDSGWGGDQRATISNTTVNGNVYQWQSGSGVSTAVCPTATAYIDVNKVSGTEAGPVNEEPVQSSLVDTSSTYRIIDCKYQYVLSIPSLKGTGGYTVDIDVPNGTSIGQAYFELK